VGKPVRRFSVAFVSTRVFTVSSISEAIRMAQAEGATDILAVERVAAVTA
jgi:hypothetical protein